ncbi:DUF1796 family putative cysteine peptidase [Caulobacter sp. BK020]|uniref:DUF1796 family putative cysteine peptidase n=1 Tax=Caulobacter sp. BK020 TaxID=2512117 RepID=UPI00104C83DE|nr:DUF1796 family putative cysteine peptidase [Caulobacter sp. BK020]TCS14535.1 putative papain-like cysteine peptidase DUF1796 [Caulobacter sp. BK020]
MSFAARQVVSLGGSCQPRHQFHRLGVAAVAAPFDNIISDLGAVIEILNNRAEGLGSSATAAFDLSTAYDDRYGCTLQHDFRNGGDPVVIDPPGLAYTADRYSKRWGNMVAACASGAPTLFVRVGTFLPPRAASIFYRARGLGAAQANAVPKALERLFPCTPFRVLLAVHDDLHPVDPAGLDDRIDLVSIPPPVFDRPEAWKGLDSAWDELAARFSFPRARPGHHCWC